MTDQNQHDPLKRLKEPGKIALILAMAERRPDFTNGNQFRDSINLLAGAHLNHGSIGNSAILEIAKRQFDLPEELKAQAESLLPNAHRQISGGLKRFKTEKGDRHE